MTAEIPGYVSVIFILTVLLTVGIFLYAVAKAGWGSFPAKFLAGFTVVWLIVQATLAYSGFFQDFDALPPRTFAFGPMPFFVLTFVYLFAFRKFLGAMPLRTLTIVHIIRIPIEFVLLWLSQYGQVPVEMSFEGRNLDMLSGITAPVVYFLAFRNGQVNRPLLIGWNIAALALLTNIVTIAVLAFPWEFQMVGFDQPNVAVTYFPYVWLPAVVVPIVFFCHIASLYQLLSANPKMDV